MNKLKISTRMIRLLFGVVVSLVAISILFRKSDWQVILQAFSNTNWFIVPQFIFFYLLSSLSRAMALRILLAKRPTFEETYVALMQGYFLNNLLPFRLGEIGRAFLLARKPGLSVLQVLSASLVERIIDLAFAASLLISTFPHVFEVNWMKQIAYITLSIVIVGLIFLYIVARFRSSSQKFIECVAERIPLIKHYILSIFKPLMDGLSVLSNSRNFILVLEWMTFSWLFNVIAYWVVLKDFISIFPFWWVNFVVGVASFGGAIPSAPATLGVFEGAVVIALVLLGISSSTALAYAVLFHFFAITMTTVIGAYGFLRKQESVSALYNQLLNYQKQIK